MDSFDDLPFPRTELAVSATRFARGIEDPAIFNHSMRTYLFGRFAGQEQGLRPDLDYDDELLFLGCVLHDVGLSEEGNGDQRFELDGADLAAGFLAERGVAPDRVEVVWDAIALHLSPDLTRRKRPEIALVSAGAGIDLGGGPDDLPGDYARRVEAALPRLRAATVLYDAIVGQAADKPHKAPPYTMPGELVRQRTGEVWPTWHQLTADTPDR